MNLYEISEEIKKLDELYMELIDFETGEFKEDTSVLDEFNEKLNILLKEKSEGIIKYIKNLEADIKAKKEESKRLDDARKKQEKQLERFKDYIKFNMENMGKKEIKTPLGVLLLRKSTQTLIDESTIERDKRYWYQETTDKFDKTIIKKLLQSGEVIVGAYLVENKNLNIK